MLEIFPTLADVKITNAWSGLMAFTADYLPKLGVRDRVHYVLGCNGGSGVVLMPWLGRAVGRRIARHRRSDPADVVARRDSL